MSTFDPLSTFVQLSDGPDALQLPVTSDFWQTLGTRSDLQGGRLVSAYRFTEDWRSWERHPNGDELVIQMNGAMDLELERAGGERYTVALRGRSAIVVPRGEWHTARVLEPSEAIFVTRGEGTEHRPL
jgi:hypothetical protein